MNFNPVCSPSILVTLFLSLFLSFTPRYRYSNALAVNGFAVEAAPAVNPDAILEGERHKRRAPTAILVYHVVAFLETFDAAEYTLF